MLIEMGGVCGVWYLDEEVPLLLVAHMNRFDYWPNQRSNPRGKDLMYGLLGLGGEFERSGGQMLFGTLLAYPEDDESAAAVGHRGDVLREFGPGVLIRAQLGLEIEGLVLFEVGGYCPGDVVRSKRPRINAEQLVESAPCNRHV